MLTLLTAYSGFLISRLVHVVSGAVLFGDIGEAAAGAKVGLKSLLSHPLHIISSCHPLTHYSHQYAHFV